MFKTKQILYILILLGMIFISKSCPVLAEVSISPEIIQVNMESHYFEGHFSVVNKNNTDLECSTDIYEINQKPGSDLNIDELRSWFTFSQPNFVLKANTEQIIDFAIRIPATTCAGNYNLRIQITNNMNGQTIANGIITLIIKAIISVELIDSYSDLETKASGIFSTTACFLVDANVNKANMQVEVIPMKRVSSKYIEPMILPDLSMKIVISPTDALPINNGYQAGYIKYADESTAHNSYISEILDFICDKQSGFHQEILVTVWWKQDDPLMAAGKYIGQIKLTASADINN